MLLALMVYNAPKWFLALRRAWLAVVGEVSKCGPYHFRGIFFVVEVTVESISLCV